MEEGVTGFVTVEGRGDRQCYVWTRGGAEGQEAGPNITLPVSEARGARTPRPM